MLDYIGLGGGKSALLNAVITARLFGSADDPAAILINHTKVVVADALCVQMVAKINPAQEIFFFEHGQRPKASKDAMQWDKEHQSAILPLFTSFRVAALGEKSTNKEGHHKKRLVEDGNAMRELCREFAAELVAASLGGLTENKALARIGIPRAELDAAVAGCSVPVESKPAPQIAPAPRGSPTAGEVEAAIADLFGGAPVAVQAPLSSEIGFRDITAEARIMAPADAATAPAPLKARKRGRGANMAVQLPSFVAQAIREMGIGDTDAHKATGIPRSTWNKAADGRATEIGLDADKAQALAKWVAGIRATADRLCGFLAEQGLLVEGAAA
jgi:hypothetical protein